MKYQLGLLIALCGLLNGCSQMSVEVSVLDSSFRNSDEYLEATVANDAIKARQIISEFDSGKLQNDIDSRVGATLTAYETHPATAPAIHISTGVDPELRKSFSQKVSQAVVTKFKDQLNLALDEQRQAIGKQAGSSERRAAFQLAAQDFEAGVARAPGHGVESAAIDEAFNDVEKDSFLDQPDAKVNIATIKTQVTQDVHQAVAEEWPSLSSNSLFDDAFSGVVVYAPDKYWLGKYNRTYGLGTVGNTDIAIRMDSIGNFTVKGVREDASKVTPATFQGIQTAIKVAASIEGIPMAGDSTGQSASTPPANGSTPAPADSKASDNAAAQHKLLDSRGAALAIIGAITSQQAAINSATPDDRASAISRIKAAIAQQKANLEMD